MCDFSIRCIFPPCLGGPGAREFERFSEVGLVFVSLETRLWNQNIILKSWACSFQASGRCKVVLLKMGLVVRKGECKNRGNPCAFSLRSSPQNSLLPFHLSLFFLSVTLFQGADLKEGHMNEGKMIDLWKALRTQWVGTQRVFLSRGGWLGLWETSRENCPVSRALHCTWRVRRNRMQLRGPKASVASRAAVGGRRQSLSASVGADGH